LLSVESAQPLALSLDLQELFPQSTSLPGSDPTELHIRDCRRSELIHIEQLLEGCEGILAVLVGSDDTEHLWRTVQGCNDGLQPVTDSAAGLT
jgi:hypothetical protein